MQDNTKSPNRIATRIVGGLTIVGAVFLGSSGAALAGGDLADWQANYGTGSDGVYNQDGAVVANDYVVWRDVSGSSTTDGESATTATIIDDTATSTGK